MKPLSEEICSTIYPISRNKFDIIDEEILKLVNQKYMYSIKSYKFLINFQTSNDNIIQIIESELRKELKKEYV